jgi:hypothetical protein
MPSSIINSDDGTVSGTAGLKSSAGNDGVLKIQNNGSDSVTISAGSVSIAGTSTAGADLKLYEDTDNGTNYVALKAPASVASNLTLTLPSADGTSGQALTTNGSGGLSFATIGGAANVQTFNTSGTWTKPSSGSMARVQMWGGGGGGARHTGTNGCGGGGGGGYNEVTVPLSYLDSSVSVTVAAGGAGRTASTGAGTAGGNTSVPFANYEGSARTFYAYGGAGGSNVADTFAGGGGLLSAGSLNSAGANIIGSPWPVVSNSINPYEKIWAGGTGSNGSSTNGIDALVVFGGNGGAGASGTGNTTGGTPVYGGKGGDGGRVTSGFDGTAPAGGGGGRNNNLNGGNGAAGRVIVTVW